MKKIISLILVYFVFIFYGFGQITTRKVAEKSENYSSSLKYDSSEIFLGNDVKKYVGQELYLIGKSSELRKYGYEGFLIDYKDESLLNEKNIYKCCESYHSKYSELVGKYFKVLDVIKHPKALEDEYLYGKKYFLKLQEKSSGDVVYYEYDSEFKHTFPFIVVGYFDKLKHTQIGKKFVVRGKNWLSHDVMTDMNTGKPVSDFIAGKVWKSVDVAIEEKYYSLSLIIENDKGEQIPLDIDNSKSDYWVFEFNRSEKFKAKFGLDNWLKFSKEK